MRRRGGARSLMRDVRRHSLPSLGGFEVKKHILLLLVILPPLLATAAENMSGTAAGGRELTFHDEPYWITITIPESRDTFQNRVLTSSGTPARRAIAKFAFTPPGEGPPNTSMTLYVYNRHKDNDDSVTLSINPTPQEFVTEYKAHSAHFYPSLAPAKLEAGNVSTLRLGDRSWFKFNKWDVQSRWVQYVTIVDDKKMLVLEWNPPRDTFFKRNRAKKKRPEIESMLASVRLTEDP